MGYETATIPIAAHVVAGEWMTCVIELEWVFKYAYDKESGADGYVLDTLMMDITGEGRLGFEYMAFVEASDYLVLGDQLGVNQQNGKFVVITTLEGGSPK